MSSNELRKKFLEFFKKREHAIVPSSSLMPDDPSVLLTTAGMQQFKKYYTGEADALQDFKSKNTASVQKCFRTSDIDEVGDDTHLTFFEMLGNFSFGGYFKEESIRFAHDFLVNNLNLKIDYVSVFKGTKGVPADTESEKIWKKVDPSIEVRKFGREDNFWGPTGSEGPCGPTTEIYINGTEIWNIVFNQYYSHPDGKLDPLKTPGVDTGMGLERLSMVTRNVKNIFETDLFRPLLNALPEEISERNRRIIADHLRGIAFLLADGFRPSNKEAGYVLRRLIRRVLVYGERYNIPPHVFEALLHDVVHEYGKFYKELMSTSDVIHTEFALEREKFSRTLARGLKELSKESKIDSEKAFRLYETFGLPYEIIKEFAGERGRILTRDGFDEEFRKHQERSRAGLEKKFGGHGLLLDTGELKAKDEAELKKVTRLHTATHLLQAALRKVLGEEVKQMGSDITAERTRFDFSFPRKLTPDEIEKIEQLVNEAISKQLKISMEEMKFEDAQKSGALHFFKQKYPPRVKVYTMGSKEEEFSKEICGGPHVLNTDEVGKFVILKEEAVAGGVRRIRAAVL
ncbi:alanine--tRNA ligase [Candidatus Giovannonibacteria bacterium]|nr:alanine--tRNA ligase [Candidatus Giovannonibacteria bacterium]